MKPGARLGQDDVQANFDACKGRVPRQKEECIGIAQSRPVACNFSRRNLGYSIMALGSLPQESCSMSSEARASMPNIFAEYVEIKEYVSIK